MKCQKAEPRPVEFEIHSDCALTVLPKLIADERVGYGSGTKWLVAWVEGPAASVRFGFDVAVDAHESLDASGGREYRSRSMLESPEVSESEFEQ